MRWGDGIAAYDRIGLREGPITVPHSLVIDLSAPPACGVVGKRLGEHGTGRKGKPE